MASTVTTLRLELARHLSQALSGDFVVVSAPDHPLVMQSVDLLVGGRSGITAIMMSTAHERRQINLFDARLKLNMMALPPHTVFVRIAQSDEKTRNVDGVFFAELSLDDRRTRAELTKLASSPPKVRRLEQAEKAQRRSEERFADTYRLARVLQFRSNNEKGIFSAKVSRAPLRDRIGNDVDAAFFEEKPTLGAVTHLTMSDADRWYGITEGEVEPKHSAASALFLPYYPEVGGDPDKAIRAAAFAGWVMAPLHSKRSHDDVSELIHRYTRLK